MDARLTAARSGAAPALQPERVRGQRARARSAIVHAGLPAASRCRSFIDLTPFTFAGIDYAARHRTKAHPHQNGKPLARRAAGRSQPASFPSAPFLVCRSRPECSCDRRPRIAGRLAGRPLPGRPHRLHQARSQRDYRHPQNRGGALRGPANARAPFQTVPAGRRPGLRLVWRGFELCGALHRRCIEEFLCRIPVSGIGRPQRPPTLYHSRLVLVVAHDSEPRAQIDSSDHDRDGQPRSARRNTVLTQGSGRAVGDSLGRRGGSNLTRCPRPEFDVGHCLAAADEAGRWSATCRRPP